MGNKASKKKSGADDDERNKKRSSFKDSLRSLTGREKRKEPEIAEDKGPKIKLQVPVENYSFPFENIVFEGGGNKALAYCGAVRALEELGLWSRIRRVCGVSSGALVAAMLSIGFNSYQLERYLSQDLSDLFLDHSCGCCSFLPNMTSGFGWNPAKKFHKWFGDKVKDTTGSADITFMEVFKRYGCELCIPVTNVSQMALEYCHPKTTPNMPIREAVRMSLTLPGVIQPVKYKTRDFLEYFVDGGLLCNYPLHSFDGWWLSLKPGDNFLGKLNPLSRIGLGLDHNNRFGGFNDRTLGFLTQADYEEDILQTAFKERSTTSNSTAPDTQKAKCRNELKESRKHFLDKHTDLSIALKSFLAALKEHKLDTTRALSRNDLQNVLTKRTELSDIDLRILFGKNATADSIFKDLNIGKNENLDIADFVRQIDNRGMSHLSHYMTYRRKDIRNLPDYILALQETVLTTSGRSNLLRRDLERSVGINTYHVGASDLELTREDRQFLVEQGKKATKDYMEYYISQRLQTEAAGQKASSFHEDPTRFMDDELSEIIDHRDYMEDFFGKIL